MNDRSAGAGVREQGESSALSSVLIAVVAQGVSIMFSATLAMVLPRVLSIEQFGYWQLFMLYALVTAYFHFGVNDGLNLRLGGARLGELDNKAVSTQFWMALVFQVLLAASLAALAWFFVGESFTKFALVAALVSRVAHPELILVDPAGIAACQGDLLG